MKRGGFIIEIEGCPEPRRLMQWLDGATIRTLAGGNSAVHLRDSDPASLRAAANRIWDLGMTILRIHSEVPGEGGTGLDKNEED